MASPLVNGVMDRVYGDLGHTQQQIQSLLRHQQHMLGSQSILHTHMQYYQVWMKVGEMRTTGGKIAKNGLR